MRWCAAALALFAQPAAAECRLALVLAIDVSSSVDAGEDALQRQGLAAALLSPEVQRAALAQPGHYVALSVFEWSGRWQQAEILPWTALVDGAAITRASRAISASERRYTQFPTAMGYALGHASEVLQSAPPCLARTVDVSGDGISNDGFPPDRAYRYFAFEDVTVNGLAITGHDAGVHSFYRTEVIHGPGAFAEIAEGFEDFERAMRRKLEREMRPLMLGAAQR